jgi:hypothetical protein
MSLVKDTHREFEESLAAASPAASGGGEQNDDEFDDDDDFGEDSYSSEEVPFVEACLVVMKGSFNMLRLVTEVMAGVCENAPPPLPVPSSETAAGAGAGTETAESDSSYTDNVFVAELYLMSLQLRVTVNDLGMEMYAPLDVASLRNQFNTSKNDIIAIVNKVESYAPSLERAGPTVEKMRNILQNIELQGLCFASVLGGADANGSAMS